MITYDLGREEGFTIDDIARAVNERFFRKPVCSLCGIVKRYIYNRIALEHGFDLVLTGHNLNDLYGFIMSDLANGDIDDLVKLKPYIPGSEGFIAKAKPLYFNYEYENTLYTIALGVKPVYQPCPHAETQRDPLVMSFKKQLLELEKKHPGIGMMFLKNIVENLIPSLEKQFIEEKREIIRCSLCGMPSSTNPCSFCRLKTRTIKYLSKHHT